MAKLSIKPVGFERTVSSLSTTELINLVANGDAPLKLREEASLKLDKMRVTLGNVKAYV